MTTIETTQLLKILVGMQARNASNIVTLTCEEDLSDEQFELLCNRRKLGQEFDIAIAALQEYHGA